MTNNNKKQKAGTYFECLKCGDRIYYDTGKKMTPCKCGAIEIDGCEFYSRLITSPGVGSEAYRSIDIDENGKEKTVVKKPE